MQTPPLDLGELLLRPWRDDDVDTVFVLQQDAASRLWAGGGGLETRDDAAALVGRLRDQENRASWAVVGAATGALLGSVTVHSIELPLGNAEVGYWTAGTARGRGVAPRAVDAACRWVFATLGVDRVELCHAVENAASARVAAKAGFTHEGRLRRSFRYGDGVKHDELLWSRLADDPLPRLSIRS
ncbi:N-acetyltransferase [Blastococcus sp. TF02-8]|uniref:GNAT family N-acetyltransferase n=1 Tax=Blastococcus sp. TF02-8 TaxID=2250574 RepID=UPI000DE84EA0|nr:GNAT family protein [Blastococcus sp. TF02-8]RBY93665.1 N-acetyltransferase [Blastococcus sp. TF02-8]